MYPGYQFPRHLRKLTQILTQIEHTPNARTIVTCPPRHGKSLTVSTLFPAYYFGRNPSLKLITASYTASLTSRFASEIKSFMTSPIYQMIFPRTRVLGRAASHWGIADYGGSILATGVTSSMTGFGADCLLIDDPVRDAMYADSPSWREKMWDWYSSTAYTRLHPGAPVFVIACMTGDTLVRMSDGTERPLMDIQAGDEVATYEEGKLTTAKVLNHASMGKDAILKVKLSNGKVVRANARHPFLVADGKLKWVRVEDLRIGQFMIALDGVEFTWLRILSIEPDGYEIVYDVEIERTGNFIANGVVSHNTRWHHDDLTGRLLLQNKDPEADQWNEVYFPAMEGEGTPEARALWPERYGMETLNRIRASVGQRTWQALYQGNPTPREGNAFKRWMFSKIVRVEPNDCKKYIRYWDKAGTSGGGDYTVGALMAMDAEGRYFLVDIVRGQWAAYERERIIRATAEQDKARIGNRIRYEVWQEQEPGSGGLQSAQATQKSLAGFIVKNDVASARGSIENMADVLATQMEAGNFYMVGGHWMQQLLEEFLQYPYGVHDDQVVAVCGAFRGVSGHKSFRVDFI